MLDLWTILERGLELVALGQLVYPRLRALFKKIWKSGLNRFPVAQSSHRKIVFLVEGRNDAMFLSAPPQKNL